MPEGGYKIALAFTLIAFLTSLFQEFRSLPYYSIWFLIKGCKPSWKKWISASSSGALSALSFTKIAYEYSK